MMGVNNETMRFLPVFLLFQSESTMCYAWV